MLPDRIPVILAIGEAIDRPADPAQALEPVALMAQAVRAAEAEAGESGGGGGLLAGIDSVDLVGQMTWRYADPVGRLAALLAIAPARAVNASMGGETPVRLLHDAALRIAAGQSQLCAIVGGEAMHARRQARHAGVRLDWTPAVLPEAAAKVAGTSYALSPAARRLGLADPVSIYPLYENAAQAAWGQSPAEGWAASAALWAGFARVAQANPTAWLRSAPDAPRIGTVTADNRMIAWPYPKLMVANPMVNQASAILVTSLARARAAGVADDRLVFFQGGAAAHEAEDFLDRDRYDRSAAQSAVLAAAVRLAGGDAGRFDFLELYSCFPVVPKMALRALGLPPETVPTVTGGLTFFGGPLNNYMGHAACAMVRRLRKTPGGIGLLYGQGGYVNNHHALVLGGAPVELAPDYSVVPVCEPAPPRAEVAAGLATIETWTVLYDRLGEVRHGVVVARTLAGARCVAGVAADDAASIAVLTDAARSAVGRAGVLRQDVYGGLAWELGDTARPRPRRSCAVERDGHLTIVTIERPEAMNAISEALNAELAEAFDLFEADPEQWVAILTGTGTRAFSAGNDLREMADLAARGQQQRVPLTGFGGLTARGGATKPVIAAVGGLAMGGGFEMALACDLIVASESAVFALPEPRVGLAALAGGLHRLPRQIGLKPAMGMILTGRRVSAEEGARLGFVNEVTAPEALMPAARRWADAIMACSPVAIRTSKAIVQDGLAEPDLLAAMAAQDIHPAVAALFASRDVREGPLAFAQKRPPRWQGR